MKENTREGGNKNNKLVALDIYKEEEEATFRLLKKEKKNCRMRSIERELEAIKGDERVSFSIAPSTPFGVD